MKAQSITTPAGERFVLLPEADYHALLIAAEDAADHEAVVQFRQRLAAGEEELIPAEIVNRVLDGGNRSPADLNGPVVHYEALAAWSPREPITTAEGYGRAVAVLNALMDAGAGNEAHPLAGLLALVGEHVAAYDDAHHYDPELTDAELAELRPAREMLSAEEFAAVTSARKPKRSV